VASSVEALAEAFEGTLRELRRLRRHLKLNRSSNSISQAPPLRYLPEGPHRLPAREFQKGLSSIVFVWAPAPLVVVFRLGSDETQFWLGELQVFVFSGLLAVALWWTPLLFDQFSRAECNVYTFKQVALAVFDWLHV